MSAETMVYAVAFCLVSVIYIFTCVILVHVDRRRIKAEEELARLQARQRIHQWGPADAASDFREACK